MNTRSVVELAGNVLALWAFRHAWHLHVMDRPEEGDVVYLAPEFYRGRRGRA